MKNKIVRGIFCHDLPIYKDINGVYCSTTLTDDLFRRYFCAVDELVVATRVYPLNTTYSEAHQERISLPNVRIIDLPNLNTARNYITNITPVKNVLTEEISEADLIFIRGGTIALLAAEIARKIKKPYLLECGGCAWDAYWHHSLIGKLVAPYMEYRERIDVRDASYVIYVTEKWLQKRYPTNAKYTTFASNVILTDLDEQALLNRLKKIEEKKPGETFVLGTTAAVNNKAKGQHYVLEAIKNLRKTHAVRYEMVGGGDTTYLESVAKRLGVEDIIQFKGQLNHNEVLQWLDSIDIYIQPSRQEGLPRALIESMSRACPAVGSDIAGIPELIQDDVLFKAGDIRQLIDVLEKMFKTDLSVYARENFSKASMYELKKLSARRTEIYQLYRKDVIGD